MLEPASTADVAAESVNDCGYGLAAQAPLRPAAAHLPPLPHRAARVQRAAEQPACRPNRGTRNVQWLPPSCQAAAESRPQQSPDLLHSLLLRFRLRCSQQLHCQLEPPQLPNFLRLRRLLPPYSRVSTPLASVAPSIPCWYAFCTRMATSGRLVALFAVPPPLRPVVVLLQRLEIIGRILQSPVIPLLHDRLQGQLHRRRGARAGKCLSQNGYGL